MSTAPKDHRTTHDRKCRCAECRQAFLALVLSQVFSHGFTSTGAIRERLLMMGHPTMPNDVRNALWELNRKPNQRVEFSKRGVMLFWRRIEAEGRS